MELNNNVSARNTATPTNTSNNTSTNKEDEEIEGIGDSELTQEDFLHLLVTQLQNQDPLSPMESNDFTMQTTAFSQLGEIAAMNESIGKLSDALIQQSSNNSSLLQGSSFLGKEIEYSTNTITFDGSPVTNFNFYLGDTPDMSRSEIRIYNEKGELVSTHKPEEMVSGQNTIAWDGVGADGVQLADAAVTFEAFGSGIVESVKMANGVLFFGIDGGVVSSEHVYSVRDPKPPEPEPDPDPDKPDPDKPDPDPDKPDPDKPDVPGTT